MIMFLLPLGFRALLSANECNSMLILTFEPPLRIGWADGVPWPIVVMMNGESHREDAATSGIVTTPSPARCPRLPPRSRRRLTR